MAFLHDLEVVEFHPTLATAMVGRYLVDLGATVTTVEPPGGHPARGEPPLAPTGESLLHAYLQHGKVTRKNDTGALLRGAHLVIHSYPLEAYQRLAGFAAGEGPPHVSLTPGAEDGPDWGTMPELAVDALSGNLWLTGFPDRSPVAMYGHQTAFFPALAGVVAALAATLGSGIQRAGVSALQVQASVLEDAFLRQQMLGQPISRQGNRWRNPSPFLDLYPTTDGAVAISVYLEPQWESFCALMDRHEWLEDADFGSWELRRTNGDVIERALRAWFLERSSQESFDLLQTYRIPCAVLLSPTELLRDEQALARESFQAIQVPENPSLTVSVPALPWQAETPAPPRPGHRRRSLDLTKLRVLDFTHAWAGPWGARTLADLGMDVIRVESGVRPDPTRLGANAGEAMEGVPATERSIWFQQYSVNKRSISLEVTEPAGYEVLMRLVEKSDVVIDNFSARVMPQLRLGFHNLSAVNPRIVQVRLTGYGGTGPLQNTVAYGEPLESATGMVYLTRSGGEPVRSGIAYPDVVGGYHGAIAALAGLHYRESTGHGVLVDLSERDATMRLIGEAFAEANLTGGNIVRESSEVPDAAPAGVFPSAEAEEWIALVCPDVAWAALARQCGAPGLAALTREERRDRRAEVDGAVRAWSAATSREDALTSLAAAGVRAWPVVSTSEVVLGEDWRAAGAVVPVEHPLLGTFHLPVPPITLDGATSPMRHAPLFGEHTNTVLREVLQMPLSEIERLTAEGAINRVPVVGA